MSEHHISGVAPLDPAALRAQLHTTFRVAAAADRVPLLLVEVTDEQTRAGFRQFSILFHGPPDRLLPQGTYSFHHDALNELMLFIVPVVGSNDERVVYEACFSQPASPAP
jgi:uncharacterized protein DUF6916